MAYSGTTRFEKDAGFTTNKSDVGLGLRRPVSTNKSVEPTGLDGSPEFKSQWKSQVVAFEHALLKCREMGGRVMSIHSRRASKAVLDRIEQFRGAGTSILHWFSGNYRDLDRAIGLDCWFSAGPAMLASENGRKIVQRVPRERVLTESDGPFAQLNGATVMPWDVARTIHELSAIWLVSPGKAEKQINDNLRSLLEQRD